MRFGVGVGVGMRFGVGVGVRVAVRMPLKTGLWGIVDIHGTRQWRDSGETEYGRGEEGGGGGGEVVLAGGGAGMGCSRKRTE